MLSLSTVLAGACGPVVEAPEDLSGLFKDVWNGWPEADAETFGVYAEAMVDLLDEEALAAAVESGGQTRLTKGDLDVVDLYAPDDDDGSWSMPDPEDARPVYIAKRFPCSLDQLEKVLYHLDQNDLYNEYISYERTYTSSFADYTARDTDTITWKAELEATRLGAYYEETLLGGMRRFPLPAELVEEHDLPADHLLVTRTWIPHPVKSNDMEFLQDYQLELYLPWGDDEIIHLYGLWRQLVQGILNFENDAVANVTIGALAEWDDRTTALCAEGKP